jgi:hypothetical protein
VYSFVAGQAKWKSRLNTKNIVEAARVPGAQGIVNHLNWRESLGSYPGSFALSMLIAKRLSGEYDLR